MSDDATTPGKDWTADRWFTDALDAFTEQRDAGRRFITLDLEAIQETIYNGDGAAYRLLNAMLHINHTEGYDGMRGAPRVMLAAIQRLSELGQFAAKNQIEVPARPSHDIDDDGDDHG